MSCSFLSNYFVQGLAKEIIQSSAKGIALSCEMYVCLWMLIAEQDMHKFQELQKLFVDYRMQGHGNSICSRKGMIHIVYRLDLIQR